MPQQGAAPLAPLTRLSLHTHKNSIPAFGVCTIFAGFHFIREVIPIAIYHCNISIVSRGKGKSAVAAAAYRSGEKLTNEWDGMTHDYTRKGGVVHTEIMLPPHAPPSFSDRSTLWNSVELYEKAGNAQLAREIDAALPIELSREEQIRLVREYCSSQFVSRGMCVDYIWVLTKGKAMHRSGKVQLIDASKCFVKRRKNIGSKRVDLDDGCISLILKAYTGFENETYEENGLAVESKVFDNSFFGFTKVTVETAQADAKGKPVLKKGKKQPVKGASDTEIIPLSEDIDAYMKKNVLPYNPLAYIDPAKDKIGYEVPFTRLFYKFEAPASSESIFEDIKALEVEETILMKELFGNA